MAAQFDPSGTPEQNPSVVRRLIDLIASIPFITVVLCAALILTFDEWRLGWAVALAAATLIFSLPPFSRYASIVTRCILPFLIGRICVETYVAVQTLHVFSGVTVYLKLHEFYKEPFYTSISTLYAIITALALIKAIEDFDKIKNNLAGEARKIRSIMDFTRYFGKESTAVTEHAVNNINYILRCYARNVVARHKDNTVSGVNNDLLRKCQDEVAVVETKDHNDPHALGNLMRELSDLAALRVKRINSIGDTTPHYLIISLWIVSATLILPFFAEPLLTQTGDISPTRYTQYYMIFIMGTLFSFLMLMLADINDPFDGFWRVDMRAFEDIGKE